MQGSERAPRGYYVAAETLEVRARPDSTFSLPGGSVAQVAPCLSDVAPPSPSDHTKAVTVTGPCFFSHDAPVAG